LVLRQAGQGHNIDLRLRHRFQACLVLSLPGAPAVQAKDNLRIEQRTITITDE
jgi:hypothetical protein